MTSIPRQLKEEYRLPNREGTEVSVRYSIGENSAAYVAVKIQNGSFQRNYPESFIPSHFPSTERVRQVANRILELDSRALQKLPERLSSYPWNLNDETVLAALQSRDPEIRKRGATWLVEERRYAIEMRYQNQQKKIHAYFDELDRWKRETFESSGEWEDKFFALLLQEFSSPEQEAQAWCIFGELYWRTHEKTCFEPNHFFFKALWFKNHPCHEKCKAMLIKIMGKNIDLRKESLPFTSLFYMKYEIPECLLDQFDLPDREKKFDLESTREKALDSAKETYERKLKRLEAREMDSLLPPLPPLAEGQKEQIDSNVETGTALSIQYTLKEDEIEGRARVINGPFQKDFSLYIHPADEKTIEKVAYRILQLDRSAVDQFPQILLHHFDHEVIFAGLLSESSQVRAKASHWLLEERKKHAERNHRFIVRDHIHRYFDRLEKWQKKPALTEEEIERDTELLKSIEETDCIPDDEINELVARVFWFKHTPYYEKCKTIMQEAIDRTSEKDLKAKFGPLGEAVGSQIGPYTLLIPECTLDALDLPNLKREFPANQTRQEALALEQERYERELKLLEEASVL